VKRPKVIEGSVTDHRPAGDSDLERRQRLRERLRVEYVAGVEEDWRKRTGRPMTAAELELVLRRYPGDV
jgi:hypothetical protein